MTPIASSRWSERALAYFQAHAIEPNVASAVGVTERNGTLVFPYADAAGTFERTRPLDVNVAKVRQPARRPLVTWWPAGRPERVEQVLIVEGESDALAALTAQHAKADPIPAEILSHVSVVAVPGASFPVQRLADELRGLSVRRAILAPDADTAGDKFATSAAKALTTAGVESARLPLPTGTDLADALAAAEDGAGWLASVIADLPDTPQAVDTAALLGRVEAFVRRFVRLPSDAAATALALFVLHTHAIDASEQTPYLLVTSPERQSGKTRLLEVLELKVRRPWRVAGASEAALFRKIEQDQPTLLLDEVDAIFGSNSERVEPIRGMLNAGNRRGACVARMVGKGSEQKVVDFAVYGAKMLAGISTTKLPDTLTDRAIVIQMQRRQAGERVERFRYRHASQDAEPIRAALEAWAPAAVEMLQAAEPELPGDLSDRQADAWEALLAIADHAGGEWPANARRAALELSVLDEEIGYGAQLLAAIRTALGDAQMIWTGDLLDVINRDDSLPFGGWRNGQGLDARGLAKLLKPYGVKSRTLRMGSEVAKGYSLADLAEPFARYLAASVTHVTGNTETLEKPLKNAACNGVTDVTANTGCNGQGDVDLEYLESLAAEAGEQ